MTEADSTEPVPRKTIEQVVKVLTDLLSSVPSSTEEKSGTPAGRARELVRNASVKAALVSGTLSIPPGPLGLVTVLPDLAAVWQIQKQLVADIAACYGKTADLGKEQMIYCLFKHSAGQVVRDLVVRVGERVLVRRASLRAIQSILRRLSIKVTQRIVGKAISRWLPVIGSLGMAAYAFYDTSQVGKTSISFFERDIGMDDSTVVKT